VGWSSSVIIVTYYGLGGLGIEYRWGQDFHHLSSSALGPTQTPVQWVSGLCALKKGWSCTSTPLLWAFLVRSRVNPPPLSLLRDAVVKALHIVAAMTCGWGSRKNQRIWQRIIMKIFRFFLISRFIYIVTEWLWFSPAVTLFTYESIWISQSPPNFTVLGLSLTHRYRPRLPGSMTVSFPTKTGW
jgi:hypothetical protein